MADEEKYKGRPLGFDPEAALDALMMLFWEKGYDATTQADMAERTGLSTSSLYNTFGNKPEIFKTILQRYNAMSEAGLLHIEQGSGGLDDVEAYVDNLTGLVSQANPNVPRWCLMVNTMTEDVGQEAYVKKQTCLYRDVIARAMRAALNRAAEQGEIASEGIDEKVALLISIHVGILSTARATPRPDEALGMITALRGLIHSWRHAG